MILKLGNRDYEIRISFASIDYLDKIYKVNVDGMMDYGVGLNMLVLGLQQEDLIVALNFIKAGTILEKQKPSNDEIEEYFGALDEKGFTAFFKEALDCLKKQPLTKVKVSKILKNKEKQAEKANA